MNPIGNINTGFRLLAIQHGPEIGWEKH